MVTSVSLAAELRDRAGKGAARATRRAGWVPAVIYGNRQDSVLISLNPIDLARELRGPGFFARVYEIEAGGEKHRVLARDLHLDPVTDRPLHVDFMRFSKKTCLVVDVQVVFENEELSPGLKRGGVLNVVRHAIEFRCSPENIPESIPVDLEGLDIGDSVHISDVTLPENVELTIADRDFTIATIAAPTVVTEEAAEGEEGVEAEAPEEGEEAAEGGEEESPEE